MASTRLRYQVSAFTVAGVLLCQGSVAAKSNYAGFRGGANWSTVKGDEPADVSSVVRPMGGVVGVFGLTSWMSFQFELLWSGKGTEGTIPFRYFQENAVVGTIHLDYLEI